MGEALKTSGPVQPLVLPDEISALLRHHYNEETYSLACAGEQMRIANTSPLYTFGIHQTREDWLRTAAQWTAKADYHASRSAYWTERQHAHAPSRAATGVADKSNGGDAQ